MTKRANSRDLHTFWFLIRPIPFWATVTSNGFALCYRTAVLSVLSVCPKSLCIVVKRLDGSRCHLVRR